MNNEFIRVISTIDEAPSIVDVECFFWIDEYGWCFGYGEDTEYPAYGLMSKDFLETETNYKDEVMKFLSIQSPDKDDDDIHISDFFKCLNYWSGCIQAA